MDLVARAVFHAVDRWIADGTPPPVTTETGSATTKRAHATLGGSTRPVPPGRRRQTATSLWHQHAVTRGAAAAYLPHSSPVPGRCVPAPHAPYSDPAMLADLVAHRKPFTAAEVPAATVTGPASWAAGKRPRRWPRGRGGSPWT